MVISPTLNDVAVGDIFLSTHLSGIGITYISAVVKVDDISKRFSKADRIIYVDVISANGNLIDRNKPLWYSQLSQGLV